MASVVLVSVLGPDRVGLVAAIAEHLFDVGVNLRDTTFAALGSGAEFVAICELPSDLTAGEIVSLLIYEGVWRTMPNSCLPWCRCAH